MKANYINICQSRLSKEPSTDSLVIVPENSWEDPTVEEEISVSMKKLELVNFPPSYRQIQGKAGNTDEEGNIQKLNKLTGSPESFSFASHDTFINEEKLKKRTLSPGKWTQIKKWKNWTWKTKCTKVSLQEQNGSTKPKYMFVNYVGFKPTTHHISRLWTVTEFRHKNHNKVLMTLW